MELRWRAAMHLAVAFRNVKKATRASGCGELQGTAGRSHKAAFWKITVQPAPERLQSFSTQA